MSKKRLGKGLSALLSDGAKTGVMAASANNPSTSASSGSLELDIDQIKTSPYQPRKWFEPSALQDLAQSIKNQGLLQPIVVRPIAQGGYELIAGERRWRAARGGERLGSRETGAGAILVPMGIHPDAVHRGCFSGQIRRKKCVVAWYFRLECCDGSDSLCSGCVIAGVVVVPRGDGSGRRRRASLYEQHHEPMGACCGTFTSGRGVYGGLSIRLCRGSPSRARDVALGGGATSVSGVWRRRNRVGVGMGGNRDDVPEAI